MDINMYTIWYRWGADKEVLDNTPWRAGACFSALKYNTNAAIPRFFQARFCNKYDASEVKGEHTTLEWLNEFVLSPLAMSGIVEIKVEKDYYYVTLDMSILSYQWAFSILTLFRYPGEYYNICWNYWKIQEEYPALNKWEALCLAHQGSWFKEYKTLFNYAFYYNSGHSLFRNGQALSYVNEERTFKTLDTFAPYISYKREITDIQIIWGGDEYYSFINFDIPNCFVGTHVDKEIV